MRNLALFFIATFGGVTASGQRYSPPAPVGDSAKSFAVQCHEFGERIACYERPRQFSFVTQVPKTLVNSFEHTFSKKALPALSAVTLSTLILIRFDQDITNKTQQLSSDIGLNGHILYTNVVGFNVGGKYVPVYQAPLNLNTAIYSLGEGFTSVVISGSLFVYGKIERDYRSLQTASQIIGSQLAVGILTQTVKRISGRESPRVSTGSGGVWRPFTTFRNFADHTSRYDAFPSGHLASMMATVTVLVSNYPEKKWLKPLGYGLISLVGFAMINNGVHWAGDYPLALGIGYLCGKASVNMNRDPDSGRESKNK